MKRMFTIGILSSVLILLTLGVAMGQNRLHDHRKHHKEDRHTNAHRLGHRNGKHVDRHAHRIWAKYHHHNPRLRYAYFRDYNVYYDFSRQVYLVFNGRRWAASVEMPVVMRRAPFGTLRITEVDYMGENIHEFHRRHRQLCVR